MRWIMLAVLEVYNGHDAKGNVSTYARNAHDEKKCYPVNLSMCAGLHINKTMYYCWAMRGQRCRVTGRLNTHRESD